MDVKVEGISHFEEWLSAHGIRYIVPAGDGPDPHVARSWGSVRSLMLALSRSGDARLRASLIALLLRHPEYAAEGESVARVLPSGDPARLLILLSIVVARAMQSRWGFTLELYLGVQPRIRADAIAQDFGLPSPREDYGRACLHAAADLLRSQAPFPFNFEGDWENAVVGLLRQLAREARVHAP